MKITRFSLGKVIGLLGFLASFGTTAQASSSDPYLECLLRLPPVASEEGIARVALLETDLKGQFALEVSRTRLNDVSQIVHSRTTYVMMSDRVLNRDEIEVGEWLDFRVVLFRSEKQWYMDLQDRSEPPRQRVSRVSCKVGL